jgi:hypothetical protein
MEKIKWLEEYLEHALEVAWLEGHERALKLLDRLLYEEPGYGKLHQTLGIVYARYADDEKLSSIFASLFSSIPTWQNRTRSWLKF